MSGLMPWGAACFNTW